MISLIRTNISGILLSMRPRQWSKNLFVFAALLFSRSFLNASLFIITLEAFVVFCFISGAGYLMNDLIDRDKDRYHPEKSKRPIASEMISVKMALCALIIVLAASFIGAFLVNKDFFWIAFAYFALQTAYSFLIKHMVILDVLSITAGFVLRVYAGALVIDIPISSWLIICTFLLALFLALSKRRHELTILETNAGKHRKVLDKYSIYLLDQMISIVTASTVVAYALYTLSEPTIEKFTTNRMVFTVPFVIYGIFRYLYLVHMKQRGGNPEMMIISDFPLLANLILWVITSGIIIYT